MYNVGNNFFKNISKYGRQFDIQVELNNEKMNGNDINVFKHRFNSTLFCTIMRVIELDTNTKIEKGTTLSGKIGIKFDEMGQYDYLNYKNYKTLADSEYNEDTKAYITKAYDKMHESMIEFDATGLSFPTTVRKLLIHICDKLKWSIDNIPASFINSNSIITNDVFSNINYTYRNVLDEIAKVTCSFPCFIDDKFTLKYITETGKSINNDYLDEDNLTFTKEYFINSVVFARAEDSDTIYRKDDDSIKQNGLHEYKISDLQILSNDDRSNYIEEMYQYLKNLRFWIFDIQTIGVFMFDIADRFTVKTDNAEYSVVLLNAEGTVEQGLSEQMYTDEPAETETDYKYSTDDDIADRKTKFLIDKNNQKMLASISKTYPSKEEVNAEISLTSDELKSVISSSVGTVNIIKNSDFSSQNSAGKYDMDSWKVVGDMNYSVETIDEKTWLNIFKDTSGTAILKQTVKPIKADTYYTFSLKLLNNELSSSETRTDFINIALNFYSSEGTYISGASGRFNIEEQTDEQELSVTIKTPSNEDISYCEFEFRILNLLGDEENYTFSSKITNLQLEIGKVKTNWVASQSDFYDKVEKYSKVLQTVDTLKVEVEKKADENKITGAYLILKINEDASESKLNADKIKLSANDILDIIAGNTINLTSKNIILNSDYLIVDNLGRVTLLDNGTNYAANFLIKKINGDEYSYVSSEQFFVGDGENDFFGEPGKIMVGNASDFFDVLCKDGESYISLAKDNIEVFLANSSGVKAPNFSNSSLESLKKNFEKIDTSVLEIIKNSEIYKWNFKFEKDGNKKHYGFIIADLGGKYKTPNEVISTEGKGIDLYSMISILWKGVQEQQEEIENLKEEIKKLKEA